MTETFGTIDVFGLAKAIRDTFDRADKQIYELTEQKDGAYKERDQLVALLSALYPSWLAQHPVEDTEWDADWRWIVFMLLPDGKGGDVQASWHIHSSELPMFTHLTSLHYGRMPPTWDGHTTEQKYARVARAREQAAAERGCGLCGDYR